MRGHAGRHVISILLLDVILVGGKRSRKKRENLNSSFVYLKTPPMTAGILNFL